MNRALRWIAPAGALVLAACGEVRVGDGVRTPDTDYQNVMGGIEVGDNAHVGDLESVNGGVRLGNNSRANRLSTVNGGIRVGAGSQLRGADTVNGSVRLSRGCRVERHVETVNGSVRIAEDCHVGGDVENVNGDIRLDGAQVDGTLHTRNGDITIRRGSVVNGGIEVFKPNSGFWSSNAETVTVIIGPGAVVKGDLRFHRPVELLVHDSARIGSVHGAEAKKYISEQPST